MRYLLQALDDARGQQASRLNPGEMPVHIVAPRQSCRKDVGSGDSILDRKIDADSSHGRHGVCRIPDREQARPVPPRQPVECHGKQFHLFPVLQLLCNGCKVG